MGCCITKDEEPLLYVEEPLLTTSPDVLILNVDRSPSLYSIDEDKLVL